MGLTMAPIVPYEDLARLNAPYSEQLTRSFQKVLRRGWFIIGDEVSGFESEFSAFLGGGYCAGVASGLDALVLAHEVLRLPPGSEVIVASNTYIATIMAILRCGLRPVLVEPDPTTCNIDPNAIESAITRLTRVILVTHLYGRPCEMQAISEMANRRGLFLVEDCAQAHGATVDGRSVGLFGIGAFSFYPTKNLGALGDAGAVTALDPEVIERVKCLRNYGSKKKYHNEMFGFNSRLDEIQAAFLRIKLPHLEKLNAHKGNLASIYRALLPKEVQVLRQPPGIREVNHIFPILTPRRDALRKHLTDSGIGTEIHYPIPPHAQPAMQGRLCGSYPIAERLSSEILSLPCSGIHTEEEIIRVAEAVRSFFL